jgi:hypothetical protein
VKRLLACLLILASQPLLADEAADLFARVRGNDRAALEELRKAANAGDAAAQFQLGRAYSHGSSILPRDDAAAARWVEKAAEQGHLEAQSNIGYLYSAGMGVPHSNEKAIAWWTRAAEGGFVQAQFNLGIAFLQGKLTARDDAKALAWLKKAAAQGIVPAQLQVAAMYAAGQGAERDPAEALRWLREPVAAGNSRALRLHEEICTGNAALCEKEPPAPAYFVFDMAEEKRRILIPDAPPMEMKPHPLAGAQPHARFMGDGPRGFSISVLTPTADAGMGPLDCARSISSDLARRYGLKREEVVSRRTNENTYVLLFPAKVERLLQLKAYLMTAYRGHCMEVHLSKVVTAESEILPWFKGFANARIEVLP